MNKVVRLLRPCLAAAIVFSWALSCAVTSNESVSVSQGQPTAWSDLAQSLTVKKGPITITQVRAADWAVSRAGLIDLDDPKAENAGLEEGLEPIQIYFYVIDHPTRGRYLIDTGMGSIFTRPADEWPVSGMVQSVMNMDLLKIHVTMKDWLEQSKLPIKGVFLTHMHLDHILGSGDIPGNVPFYVGPKEATGKSFLNLFVQGSTDDILGDRKLSELQFPNSPDHLAVLDYFGDGSFYAIYSPGHTPGSMAFLIRGRDGLHLVAGDTSHTVWGWKNDVPPGDFTADIDENRKSLNSLESLACQAKEIRIYPGHQESFENSCSDQ